MDTTYPQNLHKHSSKTQLESVESYVSSTPVHLRSDGIDASMQQACFKGIFKQKAAGCEKKGKQRLSLNLAIVSQEIRHQT